MSGKRPSSSGVQRSVGGVYVPSFQTKALMVPSVGGNNFGIIPPDCMVGLASTFRQN